MANDTERSVEMERIGAHLYRARNSRGGSLIFGAADGPEFSPIELLLVAIGGCTALDVEYITGKRAEATTLAVTARGDKIRDESGNRMANLEVTFRVEFPAGEAGDAARAVLPDALRKSHDRLCTVSRTVELASPVTARLAEG
jgi:putative redox protein